MRPGHRLVAFAAAATLLTLTASGALAEPGPERGHDPTSAILATLTPRLAEVARPLPTIARPPDGEAVPTEAKLAFMAEIAGRADERWGYSARREWRAIMAWPEADELTLLPPGEALDFSLERYPVPQGRVDPAADFRASVALSWLDARRFSCQFPLRARFLAGHGLSPRGPLPVERGQCRAFERWARPEEVTDIELIYVAQRWQDATASMGHVVFRVRKKPPKTSADPERVVGPTSELAFAYVAKDPADTPDYMWKGLTGGLTAGVELERFGDLWARYGIREGRDLHVFRLKLSDEERRFFLAEVFAQSRHEMKIPYAFLTVNCATMAYDTLRALLPELPPRASLLVHPHEVASLLLANGRAEPRGVIPARKTQARDAEARRDALAEALALRLSALSPVVSAHAARWSDPNTRAATLRELVHALEEGRLGLGPNEGELLTTLAAWVDAVLDIEAFALDQHHQGAVAGASSPALEAALDLRALLPASPRYESTSDHAEVPEPLELMPAPTGPTLASGSRRATLLVHALPPLATGAEGAEPTRFGLSWQTSVLDEQVGEPRAVALAPGSRMRLLVNELVLSSDGRDLALERERLVLVDSLTLGDGVRTDTGWVGARLGFGFGAELASLSRDGMPFMLRAFGGPSLTLANTRDFRHHLALQLELDLATWTRVAHGDALFRTTLGLVVEAGLGLGPAHRLRLRGRLAPGLDLGGAVLELGADLSAELALAPDSGIFLVAAARYRRGQPAGAPLEATLGFAF